MITIKLSYISLFVSDLHTVSQIHPLNCCNC